ncbi:MAG TPA: hypothetical protein VMT37_01440 [Solirubrobacterales bacterium]|nr:hypothetical protein [Solirubrobacterales bacterium]
MKATRIAAAIVLAAATALFAAPVASADFGPLRLISRIVTEQAPEAQQPVLSADGRYLAFQGILEGRKGVFRADLESGVIAPVETGNAYEAGSPGADATSPSISSDGRYVSFTTSAQLDPVDDTQPASKDIYVADMSAEPPTYELASALDGSSQAMPGGSFASPRVALSADGRRLAFVNGADGGQVYLRDLDTGQTTLVSVRRDPVTGGMEPGVPVSGGGVMKNPASLEGAALSADGTTVAWVGAHLPSQVPLPAAEEEAILHDDASVAPYGEPLWRRVADGPLAPTRRIVGGADGPFPNLTARNQTLNVASGWLGAANVDGVPQLSADGRTVALLGNPTEASNVFLVDMSAGLTRAQAVRQLTRQVPVLPEAEATKINARPYVPLNGWIYDLAISSDGKRIAFTTARQQFPLAPPNLVSPSLSSLGLVEAYLIDLETDSLQRLSHGYPSVSEPSLPGPASNVTAELGAGASSPSLGGSLVAFASPAVNLAPEDGNEANDVFVTEALVSPPGDGVEISPPPTTRQPGGRHRLVLSAFSMPDGRVRVVAVPPVSGTVRTQAAAELELGSRPRRVAAGQARARANRPAAIVLALPRRYRDLARSRQGLFATARVSFRSVTGKSMEGELTVRFHVHDRKPGRAR